MNTNKKGFTLAELLIVVAVIAVLVAVAIPTFTNQLEKSRQSVDVTNLRNAYAAAKIIEIDGYFVDHMDSDTVKYVKRPQSLPSGAKLLEYPTPLYYNPKSNEYTTNLKALQDAGIVPYGKAASTNVLVDVSALEEIGIQYQPGKLSANAPSYSAVTLSGGSGSEETEDAEKNAYANNISSAIVVLYAPNGKLYQGGYVGVKDKTDSEILKAVTKLPVLIDVDENDTTYSDLENTLEDVNSFQPTKKSDITVTLVNDSEKWKVSKIDKTKMTDLVSTSTGFEIIGYDLVSYPSWIKLTSTTSKGVTTYSLAIEPNNVTLDKPDDISGEIVVKVTGHRTAAADGEDTVDTNKQYTATVRIPYASKSNLKVDWSEVKLSATTLDVTVTGTKESLTVKYNNGKNDEALTSTYTITATPTGITSKGVTATVSGTVPAFLTLAENSVTVSTKVRFRRSAQ